MALEYPYVTTLLPDQTIEVHKVESQEIVQTVRAPPTPSRLLLGAPGRRVAALELE